RGLGGVGRLAGDLGPRVDAIDRRADRGLHDAPRASARTIVRRTSSILNALSSCGCAPSIAIAAARWNTSRLTGWPISARSASLARHGLVATPPSASRASWMVWPWRSSAAAADASANANDARSRTLT